MNYKIARKINLLNSEDFAVKNVKGKSQNTSVLFESASEKMIHCHKN
jgi:hypothetical protein